MTFDEKQPNSELLAAAVWNATVTPRKLPKPVYHYNAEKLIKGIYKGYKKQFFEVGYHSPDYNMLKHLRTNIYMFSAAKTFQQTSQMWDARQKISEALTKGDAITSFKDFKEQVSEISDQYNKNWLETEYKTAISGGRNASKWVDIIDQAKTFPNLTYHTDHQDTVCPICEPLDGITLPVDDSFWDEFYPDNHFNCNCYITQEDEDATVSTDEDVESANDETGSQMDDMWKRNVGKDGEVFNKEHPYFDVPKDYVEFAKENFGLAIPDRD